MPVETEKNMKLDFFNLKSGMTFSKTHSIPVHGSECSKKQES